MSAASGFGARRFAGWRAAGGRRVVIAVPFLWLALFFLVPFLIVLKISLSDALLAMPPYAPMLRQGEDGAYLHFVRENYLFLIEDDLYLRAWLNSLRIAAISTLGCLLIGYPLALGIARTRAPWRHVALLLVILPFWTSFLLRVYAWMGLLKTNGLFNNLLLGLGVIDEPLVMMQTDFAVYLGIIYSYLPFMVLPLYANLERLDETLLEAAADLGAPPMKRFVRVTLPLSLPGIYAGTLLVFIPAVGEFVIPALLGGPDTLMIGRVLWDEFFANRDWPVASAVAIVLLVILVLPIVALQRFQLRNAAVSR